MVVGTLRGFDQFMNLVVDNTVEVNGDDKTDIGMVVSLFTPRITLSWVMYSYVTLDRYLPYSITFDLLLGD